MKGLESRLKEMGHLYVLIGPSTFSSGMDNAIELRKTLHATLVGEPTGGKPSSYGEVKTLTLPNSKLVVRYTSKWFGRRDDDAPSLQPDIAAPRALTDVLAGRDPVLETVLAADRKLTAGK
jgi:C-terminal processing protease CtpA/Prc